MAVELPPPPYDPNPPTITGDPAPLVVYQQPTPNTQQQVVPVHVIYQQPAQQSQVVYVDQNGNPIQDLRQQMQKPQLDVIQQPKPQQEAVQRCCGSKRCLCVYGGVCLVIILILIVVIIFGTGAFGGA